MFYLRFISRAALHACFLMALCALTNAADSEPVSPDALDRALGLINSTRADFRVDQEALLTRDKTSYKLPMFDKWFCHPLRIPFWERHMRNSFLFAKGDPGKTFQYAAELIGLNTCRDLIDPTPLSSYRAKAKTPDALKIAIQALDADAKIPDTTGIPPIVCETAAMLIFAAADAMEWRELSLRHLFQVERQSLYASLIEGIKGESRDPEETGVKEVDRRSAAGCNNSSTQNDSLSKVDLQALLAAGEDLSSVFGAACTELSKNTTANIYKFTCNTRYGQIILSGGGDDTYKSDAHYLLIIDTSGNDTYEAGAASGGVDFSLGIIIDSSGDDIYSAKKAGPSFGAGILGWGLLADLAGNDKYTAPSGYSQGCASVGMGMLVDMAGDDSYDTLRYGQGFGYFGVGILLDVVGNDSYATYCYAQGCALTLGAGMLIDLQGNDSYEANDTDIKFPSPQTPQHNCSMSQGAASGDRRDYVDNKSLAGGIGILLDGAGDDKYSGGVFSQAVGYWFGIGILDDRSGNDTYRSVWYGQSSTAHFGISYFNDGGGNDLYTSTNCMNVCASHDFSVSIFVDEAGDDRYEGASNCGQALNNSVALFVDMNGNDSYAASSFGQSINFSETGLRAEILTRAIFLDLWGDDKYPAGDKGNNKSWVQKKKAELPRVLGAGLDCEKVPLRWDIDPLSER